MSAHTPGPWAFSPDGLSDYVTEPGGLIVASVFEVDEHATIPGEFVSGDKTAANARLISAAPELLEALKDLTLNVNEAMKTGGWVPTPLHASFWDSMADALGVIAKAEGSKA